MKVKYLEDSAGVEKGTEKELPTSVANILVGRGVVEEIKVVKKEAKVESFDTKEDKFVSKRKTKSRK